MSSKHGLKIAAFALYGLASTVAHGAGFAIIEHGAQGMGNAFAGGGAVAEDASSIWFNPASMMRLRDQLQVSGHVIRASFDFTGQSATAATGAPLLGGTSIDGGTIGLVPNLYYVRHLNDAVALGLSVNAPFGLRTEYDRSWVGRYQAVDSDIRTIHVNPALAWKLTDRLSLGAGVNIQYLDAEVTSAVDFRSLCLGVAQATANAGLGATCAGPANTALDGYSSNEADGVSFGFNLGALFELDENTRFSVAYRSGIEQDLDGDAKFELPANPVVAGLVAPSFGKVGVTADIDLPASFSLSAYRRLGAKFAVMADATWTQWSDLKALVIVYDGRTALRSGQTVEPLNWRNTWRLGIGLNYYHNDRLTLRTGFAYDESPVPNATFATARLPDGDRYWVSVGASYRFTDRIKADLGYAHLFVDGARISRVGSQGDRLVGSYDSAADIFSVQVNYLFD